MEGTDVATAGTWGTIVGIVWLLSSIFLRKYGDEQDRASAEGVLVPCWGIFFVGLALLLCR